jgi:putative transcriptional regulator
MPIIVNLDVVLAQRKMRLNDLADAVGITPQNLSVLKTGKAKAVRFSTLEAICKTLDCQPGDILEYRPEAAQKESAVSDGESDGVER